LRLDRDLPCLAGAWRDEEEFSINDLVEILAEISPGGTASALMTGSGVLGRDPGPHMVALK
jgi:hypothetical protein